MKKIICILSILLFQPIFAQDGSLDTTFSVGLGIDSDVLLIKEMSDGKILLGGSFTSYNGFIANEATNAEFKFKQLTIALDETKEKIGAALLPIVKEFADFLLACAAGPRC